jgi:DNA-binding response OmpR family regulator
MELPTVLVVDDTPTTCEMVRETLQREHMHVIVEHEGLKALQTIAAEPPAVILLAVSLPDIDGYQFGQIIYKNRQFGHTPLLFLCRENEIFNQERGEQAGSTEFLQLPLDAAVLVKSIKKHLVHLD